MGWGNAQQKAKHSPLVCKNNEHWNDDYEESSIIPE